VQPWNHGEELGKSSFYCCRKSSELYENLLNVDKFVNLASENERKLSTIIHGLHYKFLGGDGNKFCSR
jgi:hypothetical protein